MTIATFEYSGGTIVAEELTPEAFSKFGYVISATHQAPKVAPGTHGLAFRQSDVSVPVNNYGNSHFKTEAPCAFNLQRFAPPATLNREKGEYLVKVIERHPYTTQTFFPMGVDASEPAYLVIVAENDENSMPDLSTVRAFVARGGQSVTYGAAVWHGGTCSLRDTLDMTMFMYDNGVKEDEMHLVGIDQGVLVTYSV
ncbi:ureidoglycolate hydrolase [Lipomyces tetrasporus]|uniref:Ureidoglycolate hydrolase n=1 Tax=Lipomyces tetrasporus TaxID=54092 RepID=A0AAD7QT37_9ASCO|nr:ureidoglycolate hydrolase [Lipomyces tetrasporus]KAJ8100984.1 ureidoglycolate hydrolase [Lipomyces tetrasporus]